MAIEWLVPIGAGLFRNLAGWLETSLKDGKIQAYEVSQLGKTLIEVFVLSMGAFFGLGMGVAESAGIAVLGSYGLSALKNAGTK